MSAIVPFLKTVLPRVMFRYIQLLWYRVNNELIYLETHLTDHCNLNCKGCRHFSPISPEKFTDYDSFSRSIWRLKELFSNIRVIRLLGGEPLLHPQVNDFMTTVRGAFPRSEIHLVTNGILLAAMPLVFWDVCAGTGVIIDVSSYPIDLDLGPARVAAAARGVTLDESPPVATFDKYHINKKGDSNRSEVFESCRQVSYCPYLDGDSGRLHVCPISALAPIYSEYFHEDLRGSDRDFISIYNDITSQDILKFLSTPIIFCSYCTGQKKHFVWGRSRLLREEWVD